MHGTTREDAAATLAPHKTAFAARGLTAAHARVTGLVVQPGVAFGHANVIACQPAKAGAMTLRYRLEVMCYGTVEQIGTPPDLDDRPATPLVAG